MILFVHRIAEDNIGDKSCCPADYFNFPNHERADILDLPDLGWYTSVVVGGGGLFHFTTVIKQILDSNLPVIGWGIGTNKHDTTELDYDEIDLSKFRVLGVRDRIPSDCQSRSYLPCVSCLNPVFQTQYAIKNEMVVYEHKDFPIPADFPKLNNMAELEEVVQLLGGAEYVLTNSYHGMYWSILLGRKVILYKPFSSRFFNSPWTVPIITDLQELETKKDECVVYKDVLSDAIDKNKKFYKEVSCLL